MKKRLDIALVERGVLKTRSQAENLIKLAKILVNNKIVQKPAFLVADDDIISVDSKANYVSRAGLKLASVASNLSLDFKDKIVLDVGSSTGGFTDYALQNGAKKIFAVDVGTSQLHPSLRQDSRIELHEKTDIRNFKLTKKPDIILIDVSFISLRDVLPYIANQLADANTKVVAMLKPQFEAGKHQINKGVIKNETVRRQILRDFEAWSKNIFIINNKCDSGVSGLKGNQERFYLLTLKRNSTTSSGRIT